MTGRIAILLRHGDYHQRPGAPSAHQPFGLTDEGGKQAEAAGPAVVKMAEENGWRLHPVIHCSNLLRGWQTAEIIRRTTPEFSGTEGYDALAERGLGSAANLTVAEIEAALAADPRYDAPPPDWKSNSHYRLPLQGAESLMDAGERVARHLDESLASLEEPGTAIVFVGHGAAFRHAAHHLGVLAFDDIAKLSMHHATPVALETVGNGPWRQAAGEWKVRQVGEEARD